MTDIMTPGTYLAKRREAAGLSIEDVAARTFTDPRISLRDRVEWLARIEQDVARPGVDVMTALARVYSFDPFILGYLVDLHGEMNFALERPSICRECGCTECDACADGFGDGCHWVDADLCSSCARRLPAAAGKPKAKAA